MLWLGRQRRRRRRSRRRQRRQRREECACAFVKATHSPLVYALLALRMSSVRPGELSSRTATNCRRELLLTAIESSGELLVGRTQSLLIEAKVHKIRSPSSLDSFRSASEKVLFDLVARRTTQAKTASAAEANERTSTKQKQIRRDKFLAIFANVSTKYYIKPISLSAASPNSNRLGWLRE